MNDETLTHFVETLEYRRFAEFCDACRQYRYIGLCYGPPGVGKTLSAQRYTRWDTWNSQESSAMSSSEARQSAPLEVLAGGTSAFYTPPVANTPRKIGEDIDSVRYYLREAAREPLRREEDAILAQIRARDEEHQDRYLDSSEWLFKPLTPLKPTYGEVVQSYGAKSRAISDPTQLLIIDEADRLKLASLEQVRDIFDRASLQSAAGGIGLVLIGMPGIEKRLSRYPQFYSRIGFVHEFRPLSSTEVRRLLMESWMPPGVRLPPLDDETISTIIRVTGGNFRLLGRLLAQTERLIEINKLSVVTRHVVEAARESLVIGPGG
jgi:DNA transposition AAA+ family ATPase